MLSPRKNRLVFHNLIGAALLALLAGCNMDLGPQDSGNGMARLARQLQTRGDDEGAANFYMRALQISPNDASVRESFAELLENHGDYAGASAQYGEAVRLAPDNADAARGYGRVLLRLGKAEEAKQVYQDMLKDNPDDVRALNGLGVSLDYLDRHEAAQQVYRQALDDKPGDLATLANLGHSYVLSGAWDEAIKLLEPHMDDPGVTPVLRQNLAEAYGMAGMDVDAERVMRMDLSSEQVKHNLAYYRKARARLTPAAALNADLGKFPTAEMAEAFVNDVKTKFPSETEGLAIAVIPEIKASGTTPSFIVRATGFAKTATLRNFCATLKKQQVSCASRMSM